MGSVLVLLAALVSVQVTPRIAVGPTAVIVIATIEPSDRNREAHVILVRSEERRVGKECRL